ncbi:hypothetical protein N665_0162s0035 [Sinapis alba]|nr:hypothetical protein N665_0162s0035 [Sinapis alba]
MAKVAQQSERYEEMAGYMDEVAKTVDIKDLNVEEKNLLSAAYKNVSGAKMASWRAITSIEQKVDNNGENMDQLLMIRFYKHNIETEMTKICNGILNLLDSHLRPTASSAESKVFYFKMKGEYHWYPAEFKNGAEKKEAAHRTLSAYKAAMDIALADLRPTHPIILELAANVVSFWLDIVNSSEHADNLVKKAFKSAPTGVDTLGDEAYKDSITVMQFFVDNYNFWAALINVAGDDFKKTSKKY